MNEEFSDNQKLTEIAEAAAKTKTINNYGRHMYYRGVAGGKSLGLSLLHLELLKCGLGDDEKFLEVLNKLRDDFNEELDFLY